MTGVSTQKRTQIVGNQLKNKNLPLRKSANRQRRTVCCCIQSAVVDIIATNGIETSHSEISSGDSKTAEPVEVKSHHPAFSCDPPVHSFHDGADGQQLVTTPSRHGRYSKWRCCRVAESRLTSFISRTVLSCVQRSWSRWISALWDWVSVSSWPSCSSLWARDELNSHTCFSDWARDNSNLHEHKTRQRQIRKWIFLSWMMKSSCVTHSFPLSLACWMSFQDSCNLREGGVKCMNNMFQWLTVSDQLVSDSHTWWSRLRVPVPGRRRRPTWRKW